MSEFKAMKFHVNSPEHSKQIQEKLFEMGYKWLGVSSCVEHEERKYLYAEADGAIMHGDLYRTFMEVSATEHILVDNEFVPVSAENGCEEPPIGLAPPYIWKEQRIADIVNAMKRYVDANRPVPVWWAEELVQHLNGE